MLRSGTVYNPNLITNNEKINFKEWKQQVENIIYANLKMYCNDLPDEDYWVSWDNGITSNNMANFILKNIEDIEEEMMDILQDHAKFYLNK